MTAHPKTLQSALLELDAAVSAVEQATRSAIEAEAWLKTAREQALEAGRKVARVAKECALAEAAPEPEPAEAPVELEAAATEHPSAYRPKSRPKF